MSGEGRGVNLNTVILTVAIAAGGAWAKHVTDSLAFLTVYGQERNDRLVRLEVAVQGLERAVQSGDLRRSELEELRARVLVLEKRGR